MYLCNYWIMAEFHLDAKVSWFWGLIYKKNVLGFKLSH